MAAREGVSPIGSQDEILEGYILALERKAPISMVACATTVVEGETPGRPTIDGVAIAQRILQLDEMDDYGGILNIGNNDAGNPITKNTSVAVMRKAYLKVRLLQYIKRFFISFP